MKKIGILTFHNVPNYGAILQAFALKKFVEKHSSYKVSLIDYRCPGNGDEFDADKIESQLRNQKGNLAKKIAKILIYYLFDRNTYVRKLGRFSNFRKKYLNLDDNLDRIKENYALTICGSDQIWNREITDGFRDFYFGLSKQQNTVPTISYAASCGDIARIAAIDEDGFLCMVQKLMAIGVRERSLYEYLQGKQVKCYHNVDPTFLLTKEEYIENFSLELKQEKYIFVYALREDPMLLQIATKVAKERHLPIRIICGYMAKGPHAKNECYDASPETFLEQLYNAEYVITNSFHGLAFSLIFEKNFNIVMPKSRGSRLEDLLHELRLDSRICSSGKDEMDASDICYTTTNRILEKRLALSKEYLISQIERASNGKI